MEKKKLFGHMTPFAWVLEITHGCNLSCWHCNCALDPIPKKYSFMTTETARHAANVIAEVNPTSRLDICGGGEMTLNPKILEIISIVRKTVPQLQIQVTTNGTTLTSGLVRYADLLNAGANIVYTDMYSPKEKFVMLAAASGFKSYDYYDPPKNAPSPWEYHGNPDLKVIIFQRNPSNWPKSRKNANLLGTWFNHLKWEITKPRGLFPCLNPPERRCNQPFSYAFIDHKGNYLLCGQDNTGETSGHFGNVSSGVDGFREFWFSAFIQIVRKNLRNKKRSANPHCSRCSITFSRCDYKLWNDGDFDTFYKNGRWYDIPEEAEQRFKKDVSTLKASFDENGLPKKRWDRFVV